MELPITIDQIKSLSVDDRLQMMEVIWESIATEPGQPAITEAQRRELERRLADHAASPDAGIPWEDVKARAQARSRR